MTEGAENYFRYLPADEQARHWGWRLLDAGKQTILPGAPYPAAHHPSAYLFDAGGGRTLGEFQLVFIAEGKGVFSSASTSPREVRAGDVLLLFPGERHHYRPASDSGWKELWAGFRGQDAERVMRTFFTPKRPVHQPAPTGEIDRIFDQLLQWLTRPVAGIEQVLASHIPLLLALIQSGSDVPAPLHGSDAELAREAKARIFRNLRTRTDLHELARSLGISYSRFRSLFKAQTGYAPREYENLIKLNRACDLIGSGLGITATADALGYSSVYYFSRAFKKNFGRSPQNWKANLTDA